MQKPLFITGIGTGIGKTLISAILTEKLKTDYWKPIQSGDLDQSDTRTVSSLISNTITKFHQETYRLNSPLSPHLSARIDGIAISLDKFKLPHTHNQLLIEGAGGLMVPLNDKELIIDLIAHLNAEVILVSQHYLGSINHTLLSIALLKSRNIPLKGIIYNGHHPETERFIHQYTQVTHLGTVPFMSRVDKANIKTAASCLNI